MSTLFASSSSSTSVVCVKLIFFLFSLSVRHRLGCARYFQFFFDKLERLFYLFLFHILPLSAVCQLVFYFYFIRFFFFGYFFSFSVFWFSPALLLRRVQMTVPSVIRVTRPAPDQSHPN
jgi:hypothetical protein